jgi:hypothetical protein
MSQTVPTEPLVPELALSVSVVRKGDTLDNAAASEDPVVAPPSYHEPVVTRRELWSYYRTSFDVIRDAMFLTGYYQCITTGITCVSPCCVSSEAWLMTENSMRMGLMCRVLVP